MAQTLPYKTSTNNSGLVILNEGSFGTDNSTLTIAEANNGNFDLTDINIGNGGNHIEQNGDRIAVTVNGSNKILIIDLNTKVILNTIDVGTTGFDGPRETRFLSGNIIAVTTYLGDVRIFNINDGKMISSYKVHGKAEGMSADDNYLFVANSNNKDYSADSIISVFTILKSDVKDNIDNHSGVYPNPAVDLYNIHFPSNNEIRKIEIYDISGNKIYDYSYLSSASTVTLSASQLGQKPGIYFLNIYNNMKIENIKYEIIR